MKENIINRKTYKTIKKYDREEMNLFLAKVYQNGFKDGSEVGENTDFRIKLSEVLNKTKGIGPIMYDRIMEVAKE